MAGSLAEKAKKALTQTPKDNGYRYRYRYRYGYGYRYIYVDIAMHIGNYENVYGHINIYIDVTIDAVMNIDIEIYI